MSQFKTSNQVLVLQYPILAIKISVQFCRSDYKEWSALARLGLVPKLVPKERVNNPARADEAEHAAHLALGAPPRLEIFLPAQSKVKAN